MAAVTVEDLMTRGIVRARPRTPFKDLAAMFSHHAVTAVPVVDGHDHVLGVVSEADLLHQESALRGPEPPGGGAGETAGGLMSVPAVLAEPGWSAARAARVMQAHHVKRLPVVDGEGRLVGIVSRGDLMRVFLRPDAEIRREIEEELALHVPELDFEKLEVRVTDGVVTLRGRLRHGAPRPLLGRLCREVDGVVGVHDRLDSAPGAEEDVP